MNKNKKRRVLCFLIALMLIITSFMPTSFRVAADDENVQMAQAETETTETNDGSGDASEDTEASEDEEAVETSEATENEEVSDAAEASEGEEASDTTEVSETADAEEKTEASEDEDASEVVEGSETTEASEATETTEKADSTEAAGSSEEDETAVDFRYQNIKLYPNEEDRKVTVTLKGMMPEGATATASDMIEEKEETDPDLLKEQAQKAKADDKEDGSENKEEKDAEKLAAVIGALDEIEGESENDKSVVSAYDITIQAGDEEYQPDEERPIHVQITDPAITGSDTTELWHIMDDGQKEQIRDFTVEEGKISFYAKGFSVYAIADDVVHDKTVLALLKRKGEFGYYTSFSLGSNSSSTSGRYYLTGELVNDVGGTNGRTGLKNTPSVAESDPRPANAIKLYFEHDTENNFYIYAMIGGEKNYIEGFILSNFAKPRSALRYTTNKEDATSFLLTESNGKVKITTKIGEQNAVVMADGATSKALIGYGSETGNTAWFTIEDLESDPDNLDGMNYGLMYYTGGISGQAMMAQASGTNALKAQEMFAKVNPLSHDGVALVAQDKDISMWTFHLNQADGTYTISVKSGEDTKYLKLDGNNLQLVDESDATGFTVLGRNGKYKNQITLSYGGKSVCFDGSKFVGSNTGSDDKYWLNLVELTDLADDDFVIYSAEKVSVSEVRNGAKVVVYTRVWNPETTSYEFYAIGHDGSLVSCYERGDNIMWVGSKVNTLEWDFTEYYWEGTTDPNYYYELFNPYSQKYLAPQIREGQMLANKKIGINMPGRKEGEYYSQILAWDDDYYAYAGLKASDDKDAIVSCKRSKAATFYFAAIDTPEQVLIPVDTIDNKKYGITMKMQNYSGATTKPSGSTTTKFQHEAMGNSYYSDADQNKAKQGLLTTNLGADGYPSATSDESTRPFSDLFSSGTEVNHLFISSTYEASGYFEFDSCQNFATLKETNDGNFKVYDALGTMDSTAKPSLQHGQFMPYDTITPGVYASKNPLNLYNAKKELLKDDDPRRGEKLNLVNDPDYYFGMELSASFVKTPMGVDAWGHDIVFEFTGDDDFWLYVDGELVIDLGGIHSALEGTVNFSTGTVKVNGTTTNLRDIFRENYKSRNPSATTTEVNNYLSKYFTMGTDGDFEKHFKDYSSHTMKVFYMERGAGASNLHMRFNLNYVTPGSVTLKKEVTQPQGTEMDLDLMEYPFRIWYRKENGQEELLSNDDENIHVTYLNSTKAVAYKDRYTPVGCTQELTSVYFLSPERGAEIHFPDNTIAYRIEEVGINKNVYNEVYINGTKVDGQPVETGVEDRMSYDSGWKSVVERPMLTFNNHVNPEGLRTIDFTKRLYDENQAPIYDDDTPFSFRLSLSNGVDEEVELASMYKYRVKNKDGKYCAWSFSDHKFVSLGKSVFTDLTVDEQEAATFETSMNGTISEIPAWYTVEVPILPVDMKYELVERTEEVPLGYKLEKYERTDAGHDTDTDPEPNKGTILKGEYPKIFVDNRRGWELQADKEWTDSEYILDYAAIYTAVYVGDQLVPDSIRRLVYPTTSVRYFFDRLADGKQLSDYQIFEVTLEDPVVDATGKVTSYSSLTKLEDGDLVSVNGTTKEGVTTGHSYSVEYTPGTPTGKMTPGNVRVDEISNVRTGGIVMTLYKWDSTEKLSGGTFVLKKGDETIGPYTADSRGRITILYDFDVDTEYVLTETEAPAGYIGLPQSVRFTVDSDDNITVVDNDTGWYRGYKSTVTTDKLIAYIDLYNKPYELRAVKVDELGTALAGAQFALYRGVTGSNGTVLKDYFPMEGFETLVSGADGTIPKIDNTLPHGKYYLTETKAPDDYNGITKDVIFTISDSGVLSIDPEGYQALVQNVGTEDAPSYVINVENTYTGTDAYLTITKTVEGNFGNKAKDFTFTLKVEGATELDEYTWSKNGVKQDTKLHTGDTFAMGHNDVVRIAFSVGIKVTITEDKENYISTFKLNDEDAETTNTMEIEMTADATLAVTNTLESIVPTGIRLDVVSLALMAMLMLCGVVIFYRRSRRR